MKMAVAIIRVEESKKAKLESRNMARITYLAFVFVPMSFVTSFLSMNTEIGEVTVYNVFISVAIPLSIVAVVLAAYWNTVASRWKRRAALKKQAKRNRKHVKEK